MHLIRLLAAGALALVVFVAGLSPALAQGAPSTTIDFGPLVNDYVWPLVGAILTALAGLAYRKVSAWLTAKTGVELERYDDMIRGYLDQALTKAVEYGRSKVGDKPLTIDVRNQIVAAAATYAINRVPDALAHFGITAESLPHLIESRLGGVSAPAAPSAAAAPAT